MPNLLNFEIKAKSKANNRIRGILKEKSAIFKGLDLQKDTYFNCNNGRLKLREGNIENSLIYYERANTSGPKKSDVNLVKLQPNSGLRDLLRKSNQIKVVVQKSREIYFIDNVKFHLDQVEGLGEFVEIEAIDDSGSLGEKKLQDQCNHYINLFHIAQEEFINCSYSDLIFKKAQEFRTHLETEFHIFIAEIFRLLETKKISTKNCLLDHACFRVETPQQYQDYKSKMILIGDLLAESMVGGRKISNYKLFSPFEYDGRKLEVIELPHPKEKNDYVQGFEHVEFVIGESFEDYANRHKENQFDWGGTKKAVNADLKFRLNERLSVKFHHQSLEDVIKVENKGL